MLPEKHESITSETLDPLLRTRTLGRVVFSYNQCESTNLTARRLIQAAAADGKPAPANGSLIVAERQTAGRGRNGRAWQSLPGLSLLLSLILYPARATATAGKTDNRSSIVTMAAALAVSRSLERAGATGCSIKWPNDVLAPGGEKLCGILTESIARGAARPALIAGVGININQTPEDFPKELRANASSARIVARRPVSRLELLRDFLEELERYLEMDDQDIFANWRDQCSTLGRPARARLADGREIIGLAQGVDPSGALLLRLPDGRIEAIHSADVETLRSEEKSNDLRPADSADWIVAPATAPGMGAIAIVRLDGPGCWNGAARVWRRSETPDATDVNNSENAPPARRMTPGLAFDAHGKRLDETLLVWFPGPRSYTGNDLAEFHCHGSPAIVATLVEALLAAGARMARPGEFTERAFFNGRVDLAQAEGVANLIASRTQTAGRLALAQLRGALSSEIGVAREGLIDLAAEIEARLDFPEEEIETTDRGRLLEAFDSVTQRLERLAATARRGRLFRDGARVVIAGRPNTGKSSLFNALVGMERALVTPHAGTTRDTIEATLDIHGIPVVLIDTAGVRGSDAEEIESLGIERALREIETADLTLFVLDLSTEPEAEDRRILDAIGEKLFLLVGNKSDLCASFDAAAPRGPWPEMLRVCALRHETLGDLENALARELLGGAEPDGAAAESENATVINQRHEERLRSALVALGRAREAFVQDASGEFVTIDLNEALEALGDILGLSLDDAILSRVFAKFCIGK